MPVESILDPKAIAANPFLKGKTAGDVIGWADRKMATARPPKPSAGLQLAQQNPDAWPAGNARRPQPRFPQVGAPISYLAQTQGVGPMPGSAGTSPPVQNLDQTVAAQRLLDGRAFSASPNAPHPDARYLVRVPSPANSAPGGSAPLLPTNAAPPVAPASFDDRFGNWPSSPQANAPARPTAPADAQPSYDGGNTGLGIYKYPTENQLGFDPGALSASPNAAAPSQPGPPQQRSQQPQDGRPLGFPVPPMVYGLSDPSVSAGDNMDDWFDRWIKPLIRP